MGSNLHSFLEKKSIRAETLENYESMEVLGVSNKVGITITDHKKSKDLSKYQLIEEGDFAYNPYRINVGSIGLVPNGIRGLVSPAYVVFKTNKDLIPELLFDFLKSNDGLFQIGKYARGTVRKALRFEDLCQVEMIVPSIGIQKCILKKKESVEIEVNDLKTELTHQQALLKKLRQQILQEAIEGKLTEEWRANNPDVEPASELLKRIQAEKEQLIKDKKIKKQKPLPPISEEEKPFELPAEWAWCRLGNIGNATNYPFVDGPFGSAINTKKDYISRGVPVLRMMNVKPFRFITKSFKYVEKNKYQQFTRHNVLPGDILFSKVGAGVGESCIVPKDFSYGMLSTTGITRMRVGQIVINKYLCNFLNLNIDNFMKLARKSLQPFLNMTQIKTFHFPLPPLAEQKAIAAKVEKLLAVCDQLEIQISRNQTHAEQLMQSVLKEAFSQPEVTSK